MKTALLFVVIILLAVGIASADGARDIERSVQSLARDLVASYRTLEEARYRNRLAVLDFEDASDFSRKNRLGYAFSEMLTQYLVAYVEDFRVIERKQLDKILTEQELVLSGLLTDEEVKTVGKLTGADLLVLGSVFEIGDTVQVSVRLVEVEQGEILRNERIALDRDLLVAETRQYLRVANSMLAGYRLHYVDRFLVHDLVVSYEYSFSKALALGFDLFYGFSNARRLRINVVDNAGVIDYEEVEKSFQQTGLTMLFSAQPFTAGPFSLVVALGPSVLAYLDKTVLVAIHHSNTDYDSGNATVRSNYIMFGGVAAISAAVNVARSWRIHAGASFQAFPVADEVKNIDWDDISHAQSGTVVFEDSIRMTSFAGWVGVSYRF